MSSYNRFPGRFVYLILLYLFLDTSIVQILHKDCNPICVFDRILRKIYDLFALIESTLMLIE